MSVLPETVHLSNPQCHALRDLVVVRQSRLFSLSSRQMEGLHPATLEALLEKGAVQHLVGDRYLVTDAGAEAVLRLERLRERHDHD